MAGPTIFSDFFADPDVDDLLADAIFEYEESEEDIEFAEGAGPHRGGRRRSGRAPRRRRNRRGGPGWGGGPRAIPVDLIEMPDKYELKADIPGQTKEKVVVKVDDDLVRIGVDRTEQEEKARYVSRTIRMPKDADLENVEAKYGNGPEEKGRRITLQ
eukprot:jgi/Astpho2/6004/fgenesh1_pg.00084_%23_21_t